MLINIVGKPGAGKTLWAVILCKQFIASHKLQCHANIHLKHMPYRDLSLSDLVNNKIDHGVVLIDEAYKYIHARQSTSRGNIAFATVLFQSRKTSNILILTEQIERSIDLYYRALVDVQILCENCIDYFQYTIHFVRENIVRIFRLPVVIAKKFYRYYNTNEFVDNSERSSQQQIQLEFMSPDERENYILGLIEKIRTYYNNPEKITLNMIQYYLFSNKLQSSLAAIIKGKIALDVKNTE